MNRFVQKELASGEFYIDLLRRMRLLPQGPGDPMMFPVVNNVMSPQQGFTAWDGYSSNSSAPSGMDGYIKYPGRDRMLYDASRRGIYFPGFDDRRPVP